MQVSLVLGPQSQQGSSQPSYLAGFEPGGHHDQPASFGLIHEDMQRMHLAF
jgi:hypothetical protein